MFAIENVMLYKTAFNKNKKRNNSSPRAAAALEDKRKDDPLNVRCKNCHHLILFYILEIKNSDTIMRPPRQGEQQQQELINQDLNPLEVPADKEDKKTADEDLSFGDGQNNMMDGVMNQGRDIFNTSLGGNDISENE